MRKLSESIWSDIQDRSSGETIRKEDDVNHMNFDTFADYIKDNYSEKGDWFAVVESDNERSRHIEIDIISGIDLSFNVVDGEIYNILIHNNVNKYIDVPGLKKIFNVNILGSSTFSVVEKDWTKSNNTFVKLIEFFLKKKTNESIWSDIQDRSSGETIRKEDDIDNLEFNEFYDYLKNTYEELDENQFMVIGKYQTPGTDIMNISLPIEKNDNKVTPNLSNRMFLIQYIHGDLFMKPNKYFFRLYPRELQKTFEDKYELDPFELEIIPKRGVEVTNSMCVEVIDRLLGMVENPILKKK